MASSNEQTSVKIPTFDGKEQGFTMFWMRFKAYAGVKGFIPAIQDVMETDMPMDESTPLDPNTDTREIAAKKRNALAVASFTMAFTTAALMMLVHRACDANWPGGLAYKIVVGLFKRYRPSDTITYVELRMMMNKVFMRDDNHPEKLFEQLSRVEEAYQSNGQTVNPHDMIAVVFTVAPDKYQDVLSAVQLEKKNNLDISDLETAMYQVWRQKKAAKKTQGNNEIALAGVATGKTCWNCGETGHISRDCPKKKKNGGKGKGNKGNDNEKPTLSPHRPKKVRTMKKRTQTNPTKKKNQKRR